jgi:hypothetical protein
MNTRFAAGGMPQNPIAQFLIFVVAGLALVGIVFMGFVLLAVLLGAGFVLGIIVWVRWWWLNRKLGRAMRDRTGRRGPDGGPRSGSGRVIEVEYTIVEEDDSSKLRD